jgi:predicted ATPase/DNA-binding CsgD family transcriptional regulator
VELRDSLTERELEIARLIVDGLSNHEIAQALVLTHGTVKWYCSQIYSKLGVNSRVQAVKALQALGLLESLTASSSSSSKVRLPTPLTPLIGRQKEIAAIHHLLQSNRLLTLTGPGGTGKTRLALAVAYEAAGQFADGVSFIDLAPIAHASLVAKAIAHVLGVMENASESLPDTLKRALAGQEHLLLVDNFEHVMDGALIIPQLLTSAPRLKVLVTSREALRVSGEQEYAVPPLTLPVIEGASAEDIRQSESVKLFQQRAAMMRPDFALTEENLTAVAEICLQLDGLPLAIELAAARCKLLSPQAMLARLDSRLNTLTGGSRDAPARQQTLRNTIEWSYNLLDESEKRLFARLAVFRGGCSLEAVEAVCGDGLPIDLLTVLASLVDKNLVQQKETHTGEPCFVMLETLHEFAGERLTESGEAEAVQRCHAEYFVALAEQAEPELHLAQQQRWAQLLETERDNLRLALEWSLERDVAVGLRLVSALWWNWFTYGYHVEGFQWTQHFLPLMDSAPQTYHPKFLVAAGRMALLQSDLREAKRLLHQALAVSRKLGDKRQAAWALVLNSIIELDELDSANTFAEEGLSLFRELDDKPGMASAFNAMGEIARVNGKDDDAKRSYEQAIALAEQTGDIRRKYITLVNMTYITQHEKDHQRAIALLRQIMLLARDMKNYYDIALSMRVLSGSLGALGEPERAARLLGAAEVVEERIGALLEPSDQSELERNIAEVRGLLDEATFQAAWAEGRKLTLEQAVAEALRE